MALTTDNTKNLVDEILLQGMAAHPYPSVRCMGDYYKRLIKTSPAIPKGWMLMTNGTVEGTVLVKGLCDDQEEPQGPAEEAEG